MAQYRDIVAPQFAKLNQELIDQLHSDVGLVESMGHYIVEGGGKRLRPVVSLLISSALGDNSPQAVRLAAVIELIHTATLLHDDVIDISSMRRGRDTANAIWGNSSTVLVGDFIYSRAFQMMVSLDSMPIMSVLSDTTNRIAEGEVMQLINAGNADLTVDDYLEVIEAKTAILFEAAARCAGLLSGASAEQQDLLAQYGRQLGTAFQLVDDALDYDGNADDMGKNIGDDLAEGKTTLPLIIAMQDASADDAAIVRQTITNKGGDIEQIAKIVDSVQGSQRTREFAQQYVDRAMTALSFMGDSVYKEALKEIAQLSIARTT